MLRYPFVSSSLKSEQGALERTLRVSECGAQRWGGGGQRLQLRRRRAPHTRGGDSVALSTAGSACPAAFRGELAQRGGQRRPRHSTETCQCYDWFCHVSFVLFQLNFLFKLILTFVEET